MHEKNSKVLSGKAEGISRSGNKWVGLQPFTNLGPKLKNAKSVLHKVN